MGTIVVRTKFIFLAFMLHFFKPTVVLDGSGQQVSWGEVSIPVAAGQHQVDIFFKYFGVPCGKSSNSVNVAPDGVVTVTYKAPWIIFLPGRVQIA